MNAELIASRIRANLPFAPHHVQELLIEALARYIATGSPHQIFLLNGYAGSGKTSITGALIKAMKELHRRTVVLAPTGRAAKVASLLSDSKASTIHKRIYRADSPEPGAKISLAQNYSPDTLFIVDESSLIPDSSSSQHSLLKDLLRHVHSAKGCSVLLLGDTAQLPPVGMQSAPAMNPERLRSLGFIPECFNLDIPMRQGEDSGILYNATVMRQLLANPSLRNRAHLKIKGFPDVRVVPGNELSDTLSDSWHSVGTDNTIIITRSNYRANRYNMAIRNQVMYAEEPLQRGDRIVIAKNDYYWSRINHLDTFLANGDQAEVTWVGKLEKMYGRFYVDVELSLPGINVPVGVKLMLRSLMSEGPAIPKQEMEQLYKHALSLQEGEAISEKISALEQDPFYNAIQAKYGYCVTCHKAQGGQWKHVYVDMAGIDPENLDDNFFRWAYTAFTRATERLFLINPTLRTV